jgi:hypothetical protein
MAETIKIEVKYSRKDSWLAAFQQYFSGSSLFYSFFGFVVFANILTLLFFGFRNINVVYLIGCCLAFSISWLLFLTYLASQIGRKDFSFTFTDEHVEFFNADFDSKIKWSYFLRVQESFQLLNFVMQNGQTISVPISNVEPEKLIRIKQLIKDKLGDKAKLKGSEKKLGLR